MKEILAWIFIGLGFLLDLVGCKWRFKGFCFLVGTALIVIGIWMLVGF